MAKKNRKNKEDVSDAEEVVEDDGHVKESCDDNKSDTKQEVDVDSKPDKKKDKKKKKTPKEEDTEELAKAEVEVEVDKNQEHDPEIVRDANQDSRQSRRGRDPSRYPEIPSASPIGSLSSQEILSFLITKGDKDGNPILRNGALELLQVLTGVKKIYIGIGADPYKRSQSRRGGYRNGVPHRGDSNRNTNTNTNKSNKGNYQGNGSTGEHTF